MKNIIPKSNPIYQVLEKTAKEAKAVVFSGLPGVGKSLYINQFKIIGESLGKNITVIQWDIARKAFETPAILKLFPMGDGVIHNGVKLSVGNWLMDVLKDWLEKATDDDIILIEAPLVGHRFIELAKIQADNSLEKFLKSPDFQMITPIPSKLVRARIESDRTAQLSDDAKVWTGAKPTVLLMLWKMICGIANDLGKTISMEGQPPYDPAIYEFVYAKVLKNRHFVPLHIEEVFETDITNEADLHNTGSLKATDEIANQYAFQVNEKYNETELNTITKNWYLQ